MPKPDVIHVEDIHHDPVLGQLTGTVIRRMSDGELDRETVTAPIETPSLAHAEADARLRRAATRR